MPHVAAVRVAQAEQIPNNLSFLHCAICGDDLQNSFKIHEDDCSNPICDECFLYRLPRQRIENPPDRFRPQANFYTQQSDAGDDESLEKEAFINE